MAINQIDGKLVVLDISENLITPAWRRLVCSQDITLEQSTNVTSTPTRCGDLKAPGVPTRSVNFDFVHNYSPAESEVSGDEMQTYFENGTRLLFRLMHVDVNTLETNYYRGWEGFISNNSESIPVEGFITSSATIEIDGPIENVAPNTLAAAAPFSNLSETATTIVWGWDPSPNAANYIIQLFSDSGYTNLLQQKDQDTSGVHFTGLTPSTTYYARIKAVAPGRKSSAWTTDSHTTDAS